MDYQMTVTPDEVLAVHREGLRNGFVAGVIFCVVVKYMNKRRRKYQDALVKARKDLIR